MKLPPDVSTRQYQTWTVRGLVFSKEEEEARASRARARGRMPGSGFPHEISERTWLKLALMGILRKAKFEPVMCSELAEKILTGNNFIELGPGLSLIVDDQELFAAIPDREE
jgi:hypothetical protein